MILVRVTGCLSFPGANSYFVKEIHRQIAERDIFNITVQELEEGKRPGWFKRMRLRIDGECVTMTFDIQWKIGKWRARWEIIKIRLIGLREKYGS